MKIIQEKSLRSQELKDKLERASDKKSYLPTFQLYSESLKLFSQTGIDSISKCGDFIGFKSDSEFKNMRLNTGSFCKKRLCPMCDWRKAKKTAYEILAKIQEIKKTTKYKFVFLTLTSPNVNKSKLVDEITDFNLSCKRLFKHSKVLKINKGYIRKLEITYNQETDTWNPHFHLLIAVPISYFQRNYITHAKWLEMWQKAKRDYSITNIDIRKAKVESYDDIFELATYASKTSQTYKNEEIFNTFFEVLKGRQLITYNGIFKELRKKLKNKQLPMPDDGVKYVYQLWYKWFMNGYNLENVTDYKPLEEEE